MKAFLRILGETALLVAVLGGLATVVIYAGFYDVAATTRHTKPVEQLLRIATVRSVTHHARETDPPSDFNSRDRALAERGAGHYEMMCRTCHGAPGKKPDPWQLYPAPPDLADALRTTPWSDAEVFWIIKNGIKDTGMSGFGGSHEDEDLWALTALVRQLQTTTPEQYRGMVERAPKEEPGHEEHGHETHAHPSEPAPPHQH